MTVSRLRIDPFVASLFVAIWFLLCLLAIIVYHKTHTPEVVYCLDCSTVSPCCSGGTGAIAVKKPNGVWDCGPTGVKLGDTLPVVSTAQQQRNGR